MTPADTTALAILGVFVALATFGGLRWLFRCVVGLAVGCVVLVTLSHLADVPAPARIARFMTDSSIVQTITDYLPTIETDAPAVSEPSR